MRQFDFLRPEERAELFDLEPQVVSRDADAPTLGLGLGAVLYTPATRQGAISDLVYERWLGLTATVLCFQDAVAEPEVPRAEELVESQLRHLAAVLERDEEREQRLPLIFLRPRSPQHLGHLRRRWGSLLELCAGFALARFDPNIGPAYLAELENFERRMLAMPILETESIIHRETRDLTLTAIKELLEPVRDRIPCVRIGATDLSGYYGLRRTADLTIYDIGVVRDVISDVVNLFGRGENAHVVAGPVWEFLTSDRLLRPQLRESPFHEAGDERLRRQLIDDALDGLMREVLLDNANGLQGKSIIHPKHVMPVNALSAVHRREFDDALAILRQVELGGGIARNGSTRMNESQPHRLWAKRLAERARLFGVLRGEHNYIGLLEAADRHAQLNAESRR